MSTSPGTTPSPGSSGPGATGPGSLGGSHAVGVDHETQTRSGRDESIGTLVSDISQDLSTLLQQEVALAKAEIKDSASKAGQGAGLLGAAGYAAHLTVLFLSFTAWMALAYLLDDLAWSALIVALVWGLVAAVTGVMGRSRLKKVQGIPRTTETAQRVPDALKGNEDPR